MRIELKVKLKAQFIIRVVILQKLCAVYLYVSVLT